MKTLRTVLIVTGALIASGLILQMFWPWDPQEISLASRLDPPFWLEGGSIAHPLGTDNLGRDEIARLLAGGRVSITTAFSVVLISAIVGTIVGVTAGFRGGVLGSVLMRATEAAFAFPGLLLAVVVLAALGPSQGTMIVVLSALGWMGFARVTNDLTLDVRNRPFVMAAEGLGMSSTRVLFVHVLPQLRDSVITVAVLEFAGVILAEASLSYLGMGIQPPESSWGLMVAEGQQYLSNAWWLVTWPGLVIATAVLLLNFGSRALARVGGVDLPKELDAAAAVPVATAAAATVLADEAGLRDAAGDAGGDLLRVEDLVVEYRGASGSTRVLDGVSFAIEPGKMFGVVGESGSGKSTIALALLGLLPPNGSVRHGDIIWGSRFGDRPGRFGVVFQDPTRSLNPLMPVGRQVAEGVRKRRGVDGDAARARAAELFELVGLSPADKYFRKFPFQLSGGQCQRVMIAGALALEPDLLIADEPTSALDVTIQAQILDLLDDLRKELGMAVLLITHDFGVVAGRCDEVLVLRRGTIVEQGPVASVMQNPQRAYTKALLDCIPRLDTPQARLMTLSDTESLDDTDEVTR